MAYRSEQPLSPPAPLEIPSSGPITNVENVRLLQLVHTYTDLVPKVLVDMLAHYITLNKAFQRKFGKPWDGGLEQREWLASVTEKNPWPPDFSCKSMSEKHATEWDVTTLSAALSAVMEPSDTACVASVTQACGQSDQPIPYFCVKIAEPIDCKSWVGFRISVTGASSSELVECFVTEASGTQLVAVCTEKAKDHDLPKVIMRYMTAEFRSVYLPQSEVQDFVRVTSSLNPYGWHKIESLEYISQCVAAVRRLIERLQAVCFCLPKERFEAYLANLDRTACMPTVDERLVSHERSANENAQNAANEDQVALCHGLELEQVNETPPQVNRVDISGNTLSEGSSINVYLSTTREQMNRGDPDLYQIVAVTDGFSQLLSSCSPPSGPSGDTPVHQAHMVERKESNAVSTQSLRAKLGCHYPDRIINNALLASPDRTMEYVQSIVVLPEQQQSVPERGHKTMQAHLARGRDEMGVPKYLEILSFIPETDRKRVLIKGMPGSGKSTLVLQMGSDWSKGYFAQDYEVVVIVILRYLPKDRKLHLKDLIYTSVRNESIIQEVADFIYASEGQKVLFIFDGFDEMSDEMRENSMVYDIITGHLFPRSSFVVTSRPISTGSLFHCVDRRVALLGFGEEELEEFITKYFALISSLAGKMLISFLSSHPCILELCRTPQVLLMICYTAFHGGDSFELPHTQHELLERLIIITVNNALKKFSWRDRVQSLQDVRKMCPSFSKLAELALDGIEKGTVIFSDFDFEVDSVLQGLFSCDETDNHNFVTTRTWYFLHLILQEFMAALAVAKKTPEEQVKFWQQHLILKYNREGDFTLAADHYHTMFLFYCRESTLSVPGIKRMLLDAVDCNMIVKPVINRHTPFLELCEAVAEIGNRELARSILSPCESTVEIAGNYLNARVAWCMVQHYSLLKQGGIRIRKDREISRTISMSAVACFIALLKDVSMLTRVEIHDLQVDGDHITDLQTIKQFLIQQKELKCFTFDVTSQNPENLIDFIAPLKNVLEHSKESLEELTLGFGVDTHLDDLSPLMESLRICQRLTLLKLKHVTLPSQTLVEVVNALPDLRTLKLKCVYLSDKNSSSLAISTSLQEHPSLKEVTVEMSRPGCSNSLVKGVVEGMARRHASAVEKLAVILHPDRMLCYTLAMYIQKVLTGSLKQLRLGIELNPSQPGESSADQAATNLSLLVVEQLLPHLEPCTELKELKVVMSDLGPEWNSDEIGQLPKSIKHNIPKCTKLQKLTVRGTRHWKVLSPITAAFLDVAIRIKSLKELTLKWCVFGPDVGEAVMNFADYIKDSQLRKVEMSYCQGLSPTQIANIIKYLCGMHTLEELVISSGTMPSECKETKKKVEDVSPSVQDVVPAAKICPPFNDVSDSKILQLIGEAVRQNTSITTIRIICAELRWSNIAIAILKGAMENTSLRDLELVIPRLDDSPEPSAVPTPEDITTHPVVEAVKCLRDTKLQLRLVVRAGNNHYL